jgi:predicted lipid-binding transport protein (Tim44 family)
MYQQPQWQQPQAPVPPQWQPIQPQWIPVAPQPQQGPPSNNAAKGIATGCMLIGMLFGFIGLFPILGFFAGLVSLACLAVALVAMLVVFYK